MSQIQRTVSPIDGQVCVERAEAGDEMIAAALARAQSASRNWRDVPRDERIEICRRFAAAMVSRKEVIGDEITIQMGRPIRYTPREVTSMADRALTMCDLADRALADIKLPELNGFTRFIRREPVGVVFAIVPWNYPLLTAVNSVVPALIAGNAVILKHSPQTPLCAERMAEAFDEAGLPSGVFQYLHLSAVSAERMVRSPEVNFVAFTGSVGVGRAVEHAAAARFIGVGLELGGKDAAYVRSDANLEYAVENILDGALFNSGQSCCAVERVYVHVDLYERFVESAAAIARRYQLGDPRLEETTLGPVVSASAASFIRGQVSEALDQGAQELVDVSHFAADDGRSPYVAPTVLVNVHHGMRLMTEETFGPTVGIMPVASDDEAIGLINDSRFGLTASIWTADEQAALAMGDRLDVGTVFANRCDYLDPMLAWTGVKESGRGVTLSELGFDPFTRPKSFHLRRIS